MKYYKILSCSPDDVICYAKRHSICNQSLYRIKELSTIPFKEYGLFCSSKKNCLYFSINEKKTFGFNAPKRHYRIKIVGDSDSSRLYGRMCFSDFLSYFFVAAFFSAIMGIKTHFSNPWVHLFFVLAVIGIWALQSVFGMIAFRKEEKRMIEEVEKLFDGLP